MWALSNVSVMKTLTSSNILVSTLATTWIHYKHHGEREVRKRTFSSTCIAVRGMEAPDVSCPN